MKICHTVAGICAAVCLASSATADWKKIGASESTHFTKADTQGQTTSKRRLHFHTRPYGGQMLRNFKRPPIEEAELTEMLQQGELHCNSLSNAFWATVLRIHIPPTCLLAKKDIPVRLTPLNDGQPMKSNGYEIRAVRVDFNISLPNKETAGQTRFVIKIHAQAETL